MSGYIEMTMNLIQDIEKQENKDLPFYKERFFSIEKKISEIPGIEKFIPLREIKMSLILQYMGDHIMAAYVNMLDELGKSKDAIHNVSVICLMVPVICELIRMYDK